MVAGVAGLGVAAAGHKLNVTAVSLGERLQLGFLAMPDAVPQLERLAQLTELAFDELAAALAPVEQRIPVSRVPAQRKRATPKSRKNKAALAA